MSLRVVISRDSWRGDGSVDAPPSGYEGGTVVPQNVFIYFKIVFASLWPCWIFAAVHGLSLVMLSLGHSCSSAQAYCSVLSCWGAQGL